MKANLNESRSVELRAKAWDFVFGVLLIGGAPVVAIAVVGFCSGLIAKEYFLNSVTGELRSVVLFTVMAGVTWAAPLAALWGACQWRRRHRVLSLNIFWIEVLLGLIAGSAFYLFTAAMWFFSNPNW